MPSPHAQHTTPAYPLGRREGAAADVAKRVGEVASKSTLQQQAHVREHGVRPLWTNWGQPHLVEYNLFDTKLSLLLGEYVSVADVNDVDVG